MPPESGSGPIRAAWVALLAVVLLAAGCGGAGGQGDFIAPPERPLLLNSLSFTVQPGVNANRPVRVTLVRVGDARLVPELMRIGTAEWFGAAGEAFRGTHPEAIFDDWELVPGHPAGPYQVGVEALVAGVLFCGTRAGLPPLRVERDGNVTVEIGGGDCRLGGGRPSRPGSVPSSGRILNPFEWFRRF